MTDQRSCNPVDPKQGSLTLDIGIPELTIRRAITWVQTDSEFAPSCRRIGDSHWEIEFPEGHEPSDIQKFLRTLNEFRVRELIDDKTGGLRQRIVLAALQAIWDPSGK